MPELAKYTIGIIGSGTEEHDDLAGEIGALLAELGVNLLTGGGGGVMTAVSRAFTRAKRTKGICVGIVPCASETDRARPKPGYPNEFVELAIHTHLPYSGERGMDDLSRNHINVLTCDAIVALPGAAGTATEVELALRYGKPLMLCRSMRDMAEVRRFLQIVTRGFAIVPGVLSDAECDALGESLMSAELPRTRAGARHLLAFEAVRSIADDVRVRAIAGDAVGKNATPFRATLFDKAPDANWAVMWHQDTALPLRWRFDADGWGPWSEKAGVFYAHAPAAALERIVALRVHLDDSTVSNGPLRVIPDTHRRGVLSDEQVAAVARSEAAVDCIVPRGGIVVMRPLVIHASAKLTDARPRRVLHIEYASSLEVAPGVELALA